jgi:hypothetical protein
VKAANLGALQAARIAGTSVPDGFCIPFAHYDRFMRANGLAARIARMRQEPGFASDPKARQKALAQLRDEIVQWPVEPPPPPHGAPRGSRSSAAAGCSCAARPTPKTCRASAARACTARCPT